MKKNILARTVIALGLPLLLMMNPANADFTGYVVQMYSGTGNFSTNFDSALVGFSSTPTGAVGLYILTGDKTYASMLSIYTSSY